MGVVFYFYFVSSFNLFFVCFLYGTVAHTRVSMPPNPFPHGNCEDTNTRRKGKKVYCLRTGTEVAYRLIRSKNISEHNAHESTTRVASRTSRAGCFELARHISNPPEKGHGCNAVPTETLPRKRKCDACAQTHNNEKLFLPGAETPGLKQEHLVSSSPPSSASLTFKPTRAWRSPFSYYPDQIPDAPPPFSHFIFQKNNRRQRRTCTAPFHTYVYLLEDVARTSRSNCERKSTEVCPLSLSRPRESTILPT